MLKIGKIRAFMLTIYNIYDIIIMTYFADFGGFHENIVET